MPSWAWVLIALAVLALLALVAFLAWRRRRSERLRERFGPEYERAVAERGKGRAESELEEREKRRAQFEIRPLPPAARDRYRERWGTVQQRFVDEPGAAVGDADQLVTEVMRERGYPMDDFDQRAADLSVDHPEVVEHYRAAHAISVENTRGGATTEELRQATLHYRALFHELLETDERVLDRAPRDERVVPAGESAGAAASGERPVVREEVRTVRAEDTGASSPDRRGEQPGSTAGPR